MTKKVLLSRIFMLEDAWGKLTKFLEDMNIQDLASENFESLFFTWLKKVDDLIVKIQEKGSDLERMLVTIVKDLPAIVEGILEEGVASLKSLFGKMLLNLPDGEEIDFTLTRLGEDLIESLTKELKNFKKKMVKTSDFKILSEHLNK